LRDPAGPTQKRPPPANPTRPPPAPRAPARVCSKAVGEMKARAADVGDPPTCNELYELSRRARRREAETRDHVAPNPCLDASTRVQLQEWPRTRPTGAPLSSRSPKVLFPVPPPMPSSQHHQPPPGSGCDSARLFFFRAIVSETLYRIDCHLLISAGGFSPPSLWIPRLSVHAISNHPTLKRKSKLEVAHRTLHFDSDQVR
jgi:hypothetical protein